MSITRSSFAAVVAATVIAATLSFGLSENANADELEYIEPSTADLSQPVDACVKSTPGQPNLTAAKKLQYILDRQGKVKAATANKIGVGRDGKAGKSEVIYAVSKDRSGVGGYIISSFSPKEKHDNSTGFCLQPVKFAVFNNDKIVPSPVDRGQLGIGLNNLIKNARSYTAVFGKHHNGAIFAVHFNETSRKGALVIADGYGNKSGDTDFYEDFVVTQEIKDLYAVAIKPVNVAANLTSAE